MMLLLRLPGRRVGGVPDAGLPLALLRLHGGQGLRHHRMGLMSGTYNNANIREL